MGALVLELVVALFSNVGLFVVIFLTKKKDNQKK